MKSLIFCFITLICVNVGHSALVLPDAFSVSAVVSTPRGFSSQQELDSFVAERASALFTEMNLSERFQFRKPGETFSTPSVFWREVSEIMPGASENARTISFKVAPGKRPSEGLKDFFAAGGVVDCLLAKQLVLYMISCELLGDEVFDSQYFHDFDIFSTDLLALKTLGKGVPMKSGQFGYYSNAANYPKIQPQGPARGENVFGVRDDLCFGFNGPFRDGPKSSAQIIDHLYAQIIMDSKVTGIQRQLIDGLIRCYKGDRSIWERERIEAQSSWDVYCFDVDKINRLRLSASPHPCLLGFEGLNDFRRNFEGFSNQVARLEDSYVPKASDKEIFARISERLEKPMEISHKALIQGFFNGKTPAQQGEFVELIEKILDKPIHPYAFYQFLLLANRFGAAEAAREAFTEVLNGDKESSPYGLARKLGLGFIGGLDTERVVTAAEALLEQQSSRRNFGGLRLLSFGGGPIFRAGYANNSSVGQLFMGLNTDGIILGNLPMPVQVKRRNIFGFYLSVEQLLMLEEETTE